jgi:tRNA A-37 threonylcarbamoyl transferase component Bud32
MIHPLRVWSRAGTDILFAILRARLWSDISNEIEAPVEIVDTFFGVNIAASDDPLCDEYIIDRLHELDIHQVRMCYSYCSPSGNAQRLLDRVLDEGIEVLLKILPPREEAAVLDSDTTVQQRWKEFSIAVFDLYADKVAAFEIGGTPNRGRWSGFSSRSYLSAWNIASNAAVKYNITLAGPSVSDFEPFYNIGFLKAMQRMSKSAEIHTNNLFVERVIQPEVYDHRALGHWATNIVRLGLIKKARIIDSISRDNGCEQTYCSYNCWTRKRLKRRVVEVEQKNADYLVRYLMLAAASGALNRVYWGPLICSRDGIIDCGAQDYPKIDNVSFYKEVRGKREDFRIMPAFNALKYVSKRLKNATCLQGISCMNGVNHMVFDHPDNVEYHVAWCQDGNVLPLKTLYSKDAIDAAVLTNEFGEQLQYRPHAITEQPLFIHWPEHGMNRPNVDMLSKLPDVNSDGIIHPCIEDHQSIPIDNQNWRGALLIKTDQDVEQAIQECLPESLESLPEGRILRDTKRRNRLWNIQLDGYPNQNITIKLNRIKGIKRYSYRFHRSKAKRHWNNAAQMLRLGVNTPQPVAFFERHVKNGIKNSYYLTYYLEDAFSCRDVFGAFQKGDAIFKGYTKTEMFDKIAGFICHMHNRSILHRDLSAGNILMTQKAEGDDITIYVIDIGRARVQSGSLSGRTRLVDLMRICYKLDWNDRGRFIQSYNRALGKEVSSLWRLPLQYYEAKQTIKKSVKKKLGLK